MRFSLVAPTLCVFLASAVSSGCRSRPKPGPAFAPPPVGSSSLTFNRGDWLVGSQENVWVVLEESPSGGAPKHVGYVTSRRYREVRGGPEFTMFEVTSLDRRDVIGIVDALGNAKRFRPAIGGGIETESLGNNTLPLSVQAVFGTLRPVRLEATTERALAFRLLDANQDGFLDRTEFPRLADRVGSPDRNGDGRLDANEFADADL